MHHFKLPKLNVTQILAALGFVGTELVAAGTLNAGTEQLALQIAGIVLPAILMIADAIIHHAYAKINVALIAADAEKALETLKAKHATAPPALTP